MCGIKEEGAAQQSRVRREEQSCEARGGVGSCLQERGAIWGQTHLEWWPALVRGGCGGSGPILCTPGRTGTSQQWGLSHRDPGPLSPSEALPVPWVRKGGGHLP